MISGFELFDDSCDSDRLPVSRLAQAFAESADQSAISSKLSRVETYGPKAGEGATLPVPTLTLTPSLLSGLLLAGVPLLRPAPMARQAQSPLRNIPCLN